MSRSVCAATLMLVAAIGALGLGAYYYFTFLGLEDPFTHSFPTSFDYFGYFRYYQQTQANYTVSLESGVILLALSASCIAVPLLRGLSDLGPLRTLCSSIRSVPLRSRTILLAIPLALLEVGFAVYGIVLGLSSSNLGLSVEARDNPAARLLFLGPAAAYGGSRAYQDYYFFVLFLLILTASWYRYGSVRRVLQVGSLAMIPLPLVVYFFDRVEFGTFFASAADTAGLGWFSNALLLYLALAVFAAATSYPALRALTGRVIRYTSRKTDVRPSQNRDRG